MLGRFCITIVLAFLSVGRALPDIVDVTVSGSVTSSGLVSAVCGLATPGCVPGEGGAPPLLTVGYSFSDTNTLLGMFGDSWTANNPITGSVQSYADESTAVCNAPPPPGCAPPPGGHALYIELSGGHDGFAITYSAEETENVSMSFDLTRESAVTLYSSFLFGVASNGGELLDFVRQCHSRCSSFKQSHDHDFAAGNVSIGCFIERWWLR